MNKKSTDKSKQAIAKPKTREEIEKFVIDCIQLTDDPNIILQDTDKLLSKYREASGEERKELNVKLNEKAAEANLVLGLKTLASLSLSTPKNYRGLVIELARQLIKEYGCESHSELALAHFAAGAYGRYAAFANRLSAVPDLEYLSAIKNGYYSMLGREVERAERRYIAAITALKQLKSPSINVHFKANTAFMAQNQQVNTTSSNQDNIKDDEQIIEPA